MSRAISLWAVAVSAVLFPAVAGAGGPPWLGLPVDGAAPERMETAQKLLKEKLSGKIWQADAQDAPVAFVKQDNQSYLVFNIGEDVALADVEAALHGTKISIPRDNVHLFSDVSLQIDPHKAATKELTDALAKMPQVAVQDSKSTDGLLLVHVLMPSPDTSSTTRGSAGFKTFSTRFDREERGDRSAPDITAHALPSYGDFRRTIEKHGATLKDVVWSTKFACRPVGGVAVTDEATSTSTKHVD